jgi:Fe-S oxidoreductase
VAQAPFRKGRFIRHLPFFLGDLTEGRSLPAIAPKPFRDVFKTIAQPAGCKEKVAFYGGCLIDFAYPEMGVAVVKALNAAGIEVIFPEAQTCCGAPARYSGAYEVAGQNARDNLDALLTEEVRYVVSACPTCTVALREEFAATLRSLGDTVALERAERLAGTAIDFSTLVKRLVDEGRLALTPAEEQRVATYHDSCHLKRTLRAEQAPRALLGQAGVTVKEMAESDVCCGMGGSYSVKLPEISAPMLKRKLGNILATEAPLVATDCPGCVMQLRGGLDQAGAQAARVEVKHTAELLAERVRPGKG